MQPPSTGEIFSGDIAQEESILNGWLDDPGPYLIITEDPDTSDALDGLTSSES